MTARHTDIAGRVLIERFEGLSLHAYQRSGDLVTAGYGDTNQAGGLRHVTGHPIQLGMQFTKAECDVAMAYDLMIFEPNVDKLAAHIKTQDEFDALVSLCYNLGGPHFDGSQVAKLVKTGANPNAVASAFMGYCTAGGRFNQGLANRRHAEAALFLGRAGAAHALAQHNTFPMPGEPVDVFHMATVPTS